MEILLCPIAISAAMWHTIDMTETRTITMQETGTPSRSKGRGWARIEGIEGSFATATGRQITVDSDTVDLVIGVELRRGSRVIKDRDVCTLIVTGDPTDVARISLGSPQSYDVAVSGAKSANSSPVAAAPTQPTLRRVELSDVTAGMRIYTQGRSLVVDEVNLNDRYVRFVGHDATFEGQPASGSTIDYFPQRDGFLRTDEA